MSIRNQFRRFKLPMGAIFILLFHPDHTYGQLSGFEATRGESDHLRGAIFISEIFFKNNGRPPKYPDVKGSPFYRDDWKLADIAMKDGKHFDSVKVKLNLYSQEVVCLSSPGSEITLKDGIVDRLVIRDTNDARLPSIHVFASGIPIEDNGTTYPIFEVLSDGKAVLLNLVTKQITKSADKYARAEEKEFIDSETLYIFFNSELTKCRKNVEFFTSLFSDKKDKMEEFIRASKLKCKNIKEAIQLVNYYNTL